MYSEREGFPITSLREIKLLMLYKHPNVVNVLEIVVGKSLEKYSFQKKITFQIIQFPLFFKKKNLNLVFLLSWSLWNMI